MTSPLPLFPLGAVLFPGLVMPLHVFEERYRHLVRDLVARSDDDGPRQFGVVAIRRGWEVEVDAGGVTLFDVGCTAEKSDAKVRKMAALPAEKARERKKVIGSIGSRARSSHATKAAMRSAPRTNESTTSRLPHPASLPRTRAHTKGMERTAATA